MANGLGGPAFPGVRATPAFTPAPNSEPTGALQGVPPRTKHFRRDITDDAQQIVMATPENRVVFLTAPLVGYTIWIGDSSVNPQNGLALPPGLTYDTPLLGLQDLYAVTDAPVSIPLQIQVSIVLMAERQRIVG
jgi:hypothetical protein